MEDCVFCRIVRGEIPAKVVLENDEILAFDDITPQGPVHTLIIPKVHYASLQDDVPPKELAELFGAVKAVAQLKGVADSGYRVIVNNGPDSKQSVGHLHVHVIGGARMSHGMVVFE
jgi:histidine triad (HIT) family protein